MLAKIPIKDILYKYKEWGKCIIIFFSVNECINKEKAEFIIFINGYYVAG